MADPQDHHSHDGIPHNTAGMIRLQQELLLEDGSQALAGMDLPRLEATQLVVVENTPRRHNLVVCRLCSCYPWALLSLPPTWYKSFAYRSRALRDPRGVLSDFGVVLDPTVEVRVWDSTAEIRYLVLPQRPAGGGQRAPRSRGPGRPGEPGFDGGHGPGSDARPGSLNDGRHP